ncbi:hypothetical protein FM112_12675 [Gulosibacter sp. 10]|nr:hypothetical protein FM112_12675 [Gulosibacter sp. 10]
MRPLSCTGRGLSDAREMRCFRGCEAFAGNVRRFPCVCLPFAAGCCVCLTFSAGYCVSLTSGGMLHMSYILGGLLLSA